MAVIFAGGELGDFQRASHATITFDTATTAAYDSDFSRGAIRLNDGTFIRIDLPSGMTEGWLHFSYYQLDNQDTSFDWSMIRLIDTTAATSGDVVFMVDGIFDGAEAWSLKRWTGAAHSSVGTITAGASGDLPQATRVDVDIHWNINASGIIDMLVDGISVATFSGDTTDVDFTSIDQIEICSGGDNGTSTFDLLVSEVIVADEDTTGWRLSTLDATGAGTNTAWTNGSTSVDGHSETDIEGILSASANDIETYALSDLSANAALMDVAAVAVNTRCRVGATGPQNIQAALRTGGSDFASASMTLPAVLNPAWHVFDQNPDTVDDWTTSEVDALEAGLKSIT